jgi:hypothetical protein
MNIRNLARSKNKMLKCGGASEDIPRAIRTFPLAVDGALRNIAFSARFLAK